MPALCEKRKKKDEALAGGGGSAANKAKVPLKTQDMQEAPDLKAESQVVLDEEDKIEAERRGDDATLHAAEAEEAEGEKCAEEEKPPQEESAETPAFAPKEAGEKSDSD